MENYKFVKPYEMPQGTVPVGSTLLLMNGVIYYDNGMVPETYQAAFSNLIAREKKRHKTIEKTLIGLIFIV